MMQQSLMRTECFSLPEGPITLQLPMPISRESYEEFSEWLQLLDRKMKRMSFEEPTA